MKKLAEKVDVYQIRAEQVDCEQGRGLFLGQGKKKSSRNFNSKKLFKQLAFVIQPHRLC